MYAIVLAILLLTTGLPAAAESVSGVDVMLAVDDSGSMRHNDPNRLLSQVVQHFAGKLGPEDRLAMVIFGDRARLSLPLTSVAADGFADALSAAVDKIDYSSRLTDIAGATEMARHTLDEQARPSARQVLVLITDGQIDLGSERKNRESKSWLLESILPNATRQGVSVFGITLTDEADVELIQRLSDATGGTYYRLLAADDVGSVFDRIIDRLQSPRAIAALSPSPATSTQPVLSGPPQVEQQAPSPDRPTESPSPAPDVAAAPSPAPAQTPEFPPAVPSAPPSSASLAGLAATVPSAAWMAGAALAVLVLIGWIIFRRSRAQCPGARLIDQSPGSDLSYRVKKRSTVIGRKGFPNDFGLDSNAVGRQHARIEYRKEESAFYISDLNSKNGTRLQRGGAADPYATVSMDHQPGSTHGEPIMVSQAQKLRHRDEILLGDVSLLFLIESEWKMEPQAGDSEPETRRLPLSGEAPNAPVPTGFQLDGTEHCEQHPDEMAVARCNRCHRLICDKEDPVAHEGGKACRQVVEEGRCPNLGNARTVGIYDDSRGTTA